MLSDKTIAKINHQIQDEMEVVDHPFKTHSQKLEALDRATKLKALLTPQSSREELIAELAAALKDPTPSTPQPSRPTSVADVVHAFIASRPKL